MPSISFVVSSPVGNLEACFEGRTLIGLSYTDKSPTSIPRHHAAQSLARQLTYYFSKDPKHHFKLQLELRGTDFQKRVWRVLRTISPGSVLSYGQIARKLRSGPRAVGNACGRNPISIIVPCHRVLASAGLGGYTGGTAAFEPLHTKAWLLGHESAPMRES